MENMIRALAVSLVGLALALSAPAAEPLTAKRIVFLGDSITHGGDYVVDFACWVATKHPDAEILNLGLSSETVSGLSEEGHAGGKFPRPDLHERLDRVLKATKPDLVIACYGMNDGIYLPFDEARFRAFRDGMTRLHDAVTKTGADILHLTPPVFDKPTNNYDDVLARYSAWLLDQRTNGWKVVDIHGPMKARLAELRKDNPNFTFARDGIHPDKDGHRVMARPLLAYFGGTEEAANNDTLRRLVEKRVRLLGDAWLTATGHKRPGVAKGLPLEEAQAKAAELTRQINTMLHPRPAMTDESKVPTFTLPDPLDGVTTAEQWRGKRRAEILELYRSQVFGHSPTVGAGDMAFETVSVDPNALGGKAVRKEVIMRLFGHPVRLLIYLPPGTSKPVPAFLSMNFDGNHTVSSDPGITITEQWTWDRKSNQEKLVRPDETTRGKSIGRWPVEMILSRGYGLVTFSRADVEPDYPGGWRHGIRARKPGDWGCISAWAWTASRALDYMETDPAFDARRVVVVGHSRLGKTALWAGAQDERFAMVISNNSGEGGAAITRRCFGETIGLINKNFPHWFCANFKQYSDRENDLPVDAHMLLALSAPRPLYVASASEDLWADPKGEFLACVHADPVYRLLGTDGFGVTEMPPVNTPVGKTIRYHCRQGKHDITEYDWGQYLDFADHHWKKP